MFGLSYRPINMQGEFFSVLTIRKLAGTVIPGWGAWRQETVVERILHNITTQKKNVLVTTDETLLHIN